MTPTVISSIWHTRNFDQRSVPALANVHAQTIGSFEESNRMYAIPAGTATQGEPFEKENLPGPRKLFLIPRAL